MSLREEVQEIWDQAPKVWCKGLCWHQCTLVNYSQAEKRLIEEAGGPMPRNLGDTTFEEREELRRTNGEKAPFCPALTADKKCGIYELRPMTCRLYGAAKGLECPHGCKPNVMLPVPKGHTLLQQLREIDPKR